MLHITTLGPDTSVDPTAFDVCQDIPFQKLYHTFRDVSHTIDHHFGRITNYKMLHVKDVLGLRNTAMVNSTTCYHEKHKSGLSCLRVTAKRNTKFRPLL